MSDLIKLDNNKAHLVKNISKLGKVSFSFPEGSTAFFDGEHSLFICREDNNVRIAPSSENGLINQAKGHLYNLLEKTDIFNVENYYHNTEENLNFKINGLTQLECFVNTDLSYSNEACNLCATSLDIDFAGKIADINVDVYTVELA